MTGYFDIIGASAPHIYHSALALTPKMSIVRKLYEAHARPFVRVVHGALMSWNPNTATTSRSSAIEVAVWSQCSKFIAVAQSNTLMVDILDSATLERLQTLETPQGISRFHTALAFSPDSRVLTCSSGGGYGSNQELHAVSWDFQTGGIVSIIRWRGFGRDTIGRPSITYSTNGRMVGVCYWYPGSAMISIHDVVSGVHMHSHSLGCPFVKADISPNNSPALDVGSVSDGGSASDSSSVSDTGSVSDNSLVSRNNPAPNEGPVSSKDPVSVSSNSQVSNNIWTHGESLRFATVGLTTITIWEVGFTSETSPTEVETLSVPDSVRSAIPSHIDYSDLTERVQFLPTSYRLGIVHDGKVLVRDVQNSATLLSHTDTCCCPEMSFSSNGRFFACSTTGYEIHLWKESPTGYVLHGTLVSSTGNPSLLLSPNGESIVTFGERTIRLWHTKSFTAPPSSALTQNHQRTGDFILDFSPDMTSAVVARREDNVATVLDLKSGAPQLTIEAGTSIYGLRVIQDSVVVVGDGKVITWNLPAGDRIPNARVNVDNSTWAINFNSPGKSKVFTTSICSDLRHVALVTYAYPGFRRLYIYSASAGKYLGHQITEGNTPLFAPGGRSVWCAAGTGKAEVWLVTWHEPTLAPGVSYVDIEHPPEGYPWGSSRGYRATNDGWVLGPDGKRLLMLPPPWRSFALRRVWNGQFLALLHGALSEPVILELDS